MQPVTVPDRAKFSISFIPHEHSARRVASFLQINPMNSETLSDMFKFLQVELNGAGIIFCIFLILHISLHPSTWNLVRDTSNDGRKTKKVGIILFSGLQNPRDLQPLIGVDL